MTTAEKIDSLLRQNLSPMEIVIRDLSEQHQGHPGASGGGGHYRVRVVAAAFHGKSPLERHRMVYAALPGLIGGEIHALSLETLTPDEA